MQRVDINNFTNKKTALVMSGGVVKAAAWHLGVALALEELGFSLKHNESKESELEISTYVGSSAGSLIGLYFASGIKPMDIIESFLDSKDKKIKPITYKEMLSIKAPMKRPPRSRNYDPFSGLPKFLRQVLSPVLSMSGFFSTQGLYHYMKENIIISDNFEDYAAELFVVATQLDNSRKCIFSKYNYPNPSHDPTAHYYSGIHVAESVCASMSVPPFYSPYPITNKQTGHVDYYIDGEIRETLSTHVAVDNNCDFVISSWTHTPYHFSDEIGSLVNYGLPAICVQAIYLMIQKKIVASRARRNSAEDLLNTVAEYLKQNKLSGEHYTKIMGILERKLDYKKNVHFVDICPEHDNHKIFFRNSFSLSPKHTSEIVSMGYKRTMRVFRHHEWES